MNTELKACPFCGSEAKSNNGFSPCESLTLAWCSNPECLLHDADIGFTPESWNRRAAQPVSAGLTYAGPLTVLDRLQRANDAVCGMRTQEMYFAMLAAGQEDALLELDAARRDARALLSAAQRDSQPIPPNSTELGQTLNLSTNLTGCNSTKLDTSADARDAAIRRAGGILANIAFNLAQRPGDPITNDIICVLDAACKNWDAAIASSREAGCEGAFRNDGASCALNNASREPTK